MPVTVHYVSKFDPPHHTECHIAQALEWHGCNVRRYDVDNQANRPNRVKPGDILMTSVPQLLNIEWLLEMKRQGAKLVCWYFDWIFDYHSRQVHYLPRLRLFDVVFSTDGFTHERYVKAGVTCREWLPQGAPQCERLLGVPADTPRHDVLFLGAVYNNDRRAVIEKLSKRFNVGVYGPRTHGRRIWGRERQALIRAAKIVLGMSYRDDVPGYWSNRIYIALAANGFFLCRQVVGLDKLFVPGEHFAEFPGDPEVAVEYWLEHAEARKKIAWAGHEHCMAHHTYIHRVGKLLRRLRERKLLA